MEDLENKIVENTLFADVCGIIDNARKRVAVYINSEICLTKWHVGKRIKEDVLYNRRAEYGKRVLKHLAAQLTAKYGNGWGDKSLLHCLRTAEIMFASKYKLALPTEDELQTELNKARKMLEK